MFRVGPAMFGGVPTMFGGVPAMFRDGPAMFRGGPAMFGGGPASKPARKDRKVVGWVAQPAICMAQPAIWWGGLRF